MPTEQNKTIVRRYIEEFWNQANYATADELLAEGYIIHDDSPIWTHSGITSAKQSVHVLRTAFPDLHYTIEDEIAEGDTVVVRSTATGTHLDELMGIPPTGRRGSVTGINIVRLSNGRIHEQWLNWDALGLMQQLGVIPA